LERRRKMIQGCAHSQEIDLGRTGYFFLAIVIALTIKNCMLPREKQT
jgi:hypothetical protein